MSRSSEPVRIQDRSCVKDKKTLDLCLKIQNKIREEKCDLVDLLEPRKGEKGRRPADPGQHRVPADPVLLVERRTDGEWWTRNYVGLFQLGEERVIITSRFDQENKPFFLSWLLETCWDTALLSLETLGSAYEQDMFDVLLIVKLALQIQRAWKKGALRQYRTFEHNDSRVRGPIDVPRHIRENMGQDNGRIAYRTRAYSTNNPCNVLLLQAVDTAARKHPSLLNRLCCRLPEFQAALRTLRQEVPDWAGIRREAVLRHTVKKIVNPVYRDYEPARTAARAILRRLGADPQGKNVRGSVVTGVFLDMDKLWEDFLERELFGGTQVAAQDWNDILDGHMEIRPDFLWKEKGVVLDAKNRPVWGETLDTETGLWKETVREDVKDDVYQVLSYMLALNCQDGGVVFPDGDHGRQEPRKDKVCGRQFWRIPVYIPQAKNYPDFVVQMKAEMGRLKEKEILRAVSG